MNHSLPRRSGLSRTAIQASMLTAAAIHAHAQPIEQIEYSIVWDKPVLMPGEVQTGHVWLKASPDIGSVVQWNTSPGTGQPATLMAIASSFIEIQNIANGLTGEIIQIWLDSGWDSGGAGMPPDPNGNWKTNFGQFGKPVNQNPNTNAAVSPYHFVWDPTGDYTPREVTYGINPTSGKVYLEVPGLSAWVGENAVKLGSQASFQVVPAPPSFMLILLGCGALGARRRA